MSEFEKKHRKKEIGFRKNDSGVWGIYSDLLYDTYQKDWSKAYQLTFYCFFRSIDDLSNYIDEECFSYMYDDFLSFAYGEKYQFGEIVINDVKKLLGDKAKLNSLHGLPKHDKAPLYDIIGKVIGNEGYSNANREEFRHGQTCWLYGDRSDSDDFPKYLSEDTFAHMASAAVVNPKAFGEMKKCLPDSYKMFIEILKIMMLELCECKVEKWEKRQKSSSGELPLGPINLNLYIKEEDIIKIFKWKPEEKRLPEMSGKVRKVVEDREKYAKEKYDNEYYRGLAKKMVGIYLNEELTDINNRELTYLIGGKSKEKEMYVGYYDTDEEKNTMGKKFNKISKDMNPDLVVHLHPEITIHLNSGRGKFDRSYLRWQTMFSYGDRYNMTIKQDWIGIEFYKEENYSDSPYMIDIHYCSRDMFMEMLRASYEDIVRNLEKQQRHQDFINELGKESEIKDINEYINRLDEKLEKEKVSEKMSEHISRKLKDNILLPSIKLYSIKDFKKNYISKKSDFTFIQMEPEPE